MRISDWSSDVCSSDLIVERGDAAGGDDRRFDGLRKCAGRRDVGALQGAVAVDVGVDDGGGAGIRQAARELHGGELAHLGPALDGDEGPALVEAEPNGRWSFWGSVCKYVSSRGL